MDNVNTLDQLAPVVNIRLGKHIKTILLHLYENKESLMRQNWIIKNAYKLYKIKTHSSGPYKGKEYKKYPETIPRKLRVSACRAFKTLEAQGLIFRHNYRYKYEYKQKYDFKWVNGTLQEIKPDKKPDKVWNSKPWFGISEKGILFVNNSGQLIPDVNNKEAA